MVKGFVLQRADGTYLTTAGNPHSFTKRLARARVFASESEAEASRARGDDSRVVSLEDAIKDRVDPVPF